MGKNLHGRLTYNLNRVARTRAVNTRAYEIRKSNFKRSENCENARGVWNFNEAIECEMCGKNAERSDGTEEIGGFHCVVSVHLVRINDGNEGEK